MKKKVLTSSEDGEQGRNNLKSLSRKQTCSITFSDFYLKPQRYLHFQFNFLMYRSQDGSDRQRSKRSVNILRSLRPFLIFCGSSSFFELWFDYMEGTNQLLIDVQDCAPVLKHSAVVGS